MLQTLSQTPNPVPPYSPKAFYAHLDGTTEGIALRLADGTVHFQTTSTGLWTQLGDQDAPRLHLHGTVDPVAAMRQTDQLHRQIYTARQSAA